MINTKIAAFGTHIGLCTIVYTKEDKYRAGFGSHPNQAETDRVSRGQKQWEPNGRRTGSSKIKAKITKKSGELVCYVI